MLEELQTKFATSAAYSANEEIVRDASSAAFLGTPCFYHHSQAKCKPLPPTAAIDTVRSFPAFVVFSSEKASPESHRYLVLRPRHGHAPRRAEESSGTIG